MRIIIGICIVVAFGIVVPALSPLLPLFRAEVIIYNQICFLFSVSSTRIVHFYFDSV